MDIGALEDSEERIKIQSMVDMGFPEQSARSALSSKVSNGIIERLVINIEVTWGWARG